MSVPSCSKAKVSQNEGGREHHDSRPRSFFLASVFVLVSLLLQFVSTTGNSSFVRYRSDTSKSGKRLLGSFLKHGAVESLLLLLLVAGRFVAASSLASVLSSRTPPTPAPGSIFAFTFAATSMFARTSIFTVWSPLSAASFRSVRRFPSRQRTRASASSIPPQARTPVRARVSSCLRRPCRRRRLGPALSTTTASPSPTT